MCCVNNCCSERIVGVLFDRKRYAQEFGFGRLLCRDDVNLAWLAFRQCAGLVKRDRGQRA
jgi:hypothetical protein